MSALEEAKRLLEPGKTVVLVTIGDAGGMDARMMAVVRSEGAKTVWMLSGKSSTKHRQLSRNANCMLYATDFENPENYLELRLWGKMDLLDDVASRALVWRDDYLQYFPAGKDDPDLCVLRFTAATGAVQTMAGKEALMV